MTIRLTGGSLEDDMAGVTREAMNKQGVSTETQLYKL